MRNIWWIMRRELGAYLRSPIGYVIMAVTLVLAGVFFNAVAVSDKQRLSSDVLEAFFRDTGGIMAAAAIFVGMRLIAEEKQTGTLVLLTTSPARDWQVVAGKFLGSLAFLAILTTLTLYLPALVLVNGKISLGHIAAGYLGMLLIGATALALVMLCSALAPNQLVAVILGAAVVLGFILLWYLSRIASPPVEELLAYMSLHDKHFRPFMRGVVSTRDIVYYVSLTYVSLLATTRVLEARRWS